MQELSRENPDAQELQVRLAMISEKHSKLENIQQKILEVMFKGDASEEQFAQKIETADNYKVKYHQARTAISNAIDRIQPVPLTQAGQSVQICRENVHAYKLPKIGLPKFSREFKDWLQFWGLFKNIHEDQTLSKEDKFQYLVQAMEKGSRASELVCSFPPTAANYDKAVMSLKNRFGREDLLVKVYVREMLKLILSRKKISNVISKNL